MRSAPTASLPRRLSLTLALAIVALGTVGASAALGATVSKEGTVITVAGVETSEEIFVTYDGGGEDSYEFDDVTGPVTPGPGCTADDDDASQVDCPAAGTTRFIVELGAGDDSIEFSDDVDGVPATVDGGTGGDCLSGTDQADTMTGGPGEDCVSGQQGNDDLDGGGDGDVVRGGQDTDTARGGDGDDDVRGGADDDALVDGGAGHDDVRGQAGNDTITGGADGDRVDGGLGDDTLRGGGGDDELFGDEGADSLSGEADDDVLDGGTGADPMDGGDGFDLVDYGGRSPDQPLSVTFDGQANDGEPNEGDNVLATEDVIGGAGNDSLQALAADGINIFSGGAGGDTIDPGLLEDIVFAGDGDDLVNARDGYADRVSCGEGSDAANVDSLDVVAADCENVAREERTAARDVPEDLPPTVAFTGPAIGQTVSGPTTLTADAADDRGVARVLFIDETRVLCADDTVPYTCAYTPSGDDVGRKTLTAVAVDALGQTAAANRTFFVPRFGSRLSIAVRPRADRSFPFVFTTSGRLTLPAGVSPAAGCRGTVSVQIKARGTTISTRGVAVGSDCRYRSRVVFRVRRRLTTNRLTVRARYGGSDALLGQISRRVTVRIRRR